MSSEKEGVPIPTSEVSKFYAGKSLFITGAGGFLGLIILETLLRCCPGIRRIYILLRPKRGIQPEDRKEEILKKEVFNKLREKNPDALKKVAIVSGDIAFENLGMSEEDMQKVTEEVSIVFHCAAVINFLKSLSYIMQQNVIGTWNIIEFCRKLKKCEALVYTSTAYSNSNRKYIEEKVYDLPFSMDDILELSKCSKEDELNSLYLKCNPNFLNYYTFSKCVTENLISKKASDLPISVVRPSIITCCMKGALPGYIAYGSGVVSLSIGIGKGFIRVMRIDRDKICDSIPVDVVANTHILAAYHQAIDRLPSPFIYNCVSSELAPHTWGQFIDALFTMAQKNPLPKSFQKPSLFVTKSPVKYWLLSVFEHYIPAIVIDIFLWISAGKPRLIKLYLLYDRTLKVVIPFTLNEWTFRCENFKLLDKKLSSIDAEIFPVHLKDFTLQELTRCLLNGAPPYQKKDDKSQKERMRITYMRYFFTSLIKWTVLGGIISACYTVFFF